jgi:hypothetical protein
MSDASSVAANKGLGSFSIGLGATPGFARTLASISGGIHWLQASDQHSPDCLSRMALSSNTY